jgi:hypothetical protein
VTLKNKKRQQQEKQRERKGHRDLREAIHLSCGRCGATGYMFSYESGVKNHCSYKKQTDKQA